MRSKGRSRALVAAFLVALAGIVASLIAIAINGATSDESWPGSFKLIQDHPWPSVVILTLAGVAVAVPLLRLGSGDNETSGPGNGSGAVDQTVSGGSHNHNQVISGGSGNPNQVVSGGPAIVTHYHGVVHQTIEQASPEVAGPVPDVPGLPEFVAGALFDRRTLLDRLRARLAQPDEVFVGLVGPRGIGKTAIAAELLRTRPANVAAGYLAVRGYPGVNAYSVVDKLAAAVSVEDVRQRLVERLNDGDSDLRMRLSDVLGELGNEQVWLVVDDAQDLFVAESGAWRDEALGLLFDNLRTRRRQHRIKVLWVSETPLQLAGTATEKVDQRLPAPDFAELIGKLTIPDAPVPRVGALDRAARGHPRTAELVLGIRAFNPHFEEDPLDAAPDFRALTRTLLSSLDESQERALRLLAVLDRPVRPAVIAHLDGRSTGQVREVFDDLVRCRLIRRLDDHYYLPAGEASRITGRTATAEVAGLRGRAAEFLEESARDGSATRLADLDDAFHAVDLYLDAGEPGRAVRLMDRLDNQYLRHWGQTAALTPWLARVSEHLFDYREQVAYVKLAGRALVQQGRLAEAIDVIERGVRMSKRPEGQRVSSAHLAFLVQLAAYCLRGGQVMKAAEHYQTLLDNSPAGHKGVATAHLGLALCLTETAAFAQAEEHLEAATSSDPDLELPLLHLQALISFERDDGSGIARLERARSRAEKLDDRVMVARCDDLAAWLWLLRHDRRKAEEAATRAQEVAIRVNDPELWSLSHTTLAVLDLGRGAYGPALRAADLATRYPWSLSAAEALAVLGVASLRAGEPEENTRRAFTTASDLAHHQKVMSPGCYRPFEVEGLALAGLALLRPELGEQAALDAYLAAQQIMNLGGARFRRRELFAALTAGTPGDPLPRIRDLLG